MAAQTQQAQLDESVFDRELVEGTPSQESIDLLLTVDPSGLRRGDALSACVGVEKAIRLLAARLMQFQAAAVGKKPGGRKIDGAAHELSMALNLHPASAAAQVATARGIVGRLPSTLKRLESGEISAAQAKKVELAVRGLDATTAQAVEADAVPGAVRGIGRRLETALARHAPEELARRLQTRRRSRSITTWTDVVEGLAGLGVQGPVEMVAEIKSALDLDARPKAAGECRPLDVRRFDVLRDWARERLGLDPIYLEPFVRPVPPTSTGADTATASEGARSSAASSSEPARGRAGRPRKRRRGDRKRAHRRCATCGRAGPNRIPINVTVSLETLLRLSDTAGDLDGVPIPAEVARELAHDGAWTKWVVESGGGRFLWAGAKTYRPGDELARHIRGRDVTCRTPGCTTRAVHCDLDHAKAFSEGGETVEKNLGDLCGCHHAAKHELGWSYEMLPNGVARWTLPSRRTYDDEPEHYEDDPRLNAYLADCSRRRQERTAAKQRRIRKKLRPLDEVFKAWETPPAPDADLPF
jgi:hypothetical protein